MIPTIAPMEAVVSGDVQIECAKLRRVFPAIRRHAEVVGLGDFTLDIRRNEIVVVLGPSGCGKSTLLNLIAGFDRPTSGTILLEGQPVTKPGPDRGVVFQDYALFPWLTVKQNVQFGLKERGLPRAERSKQAQEYLELVGLEGFESRWTHELSGGMRQRVALARVFAIHPKILLMDEPFAALDAQTRTLLQRELLRVWEHDKRTVLFVTHSVDEAVFLAHRIVVMTARPGTIKEVIEVDLPFPHDPTDEAFNVLRRRVTVSIEEEVGKVLRRGGADAEAM
jgi:ABC-type nitrate/sulfonate/bicarbonate transport system ATPase subunit